MATLILSAAGAAIGAKVGGAVLGLSGLVIGRAIGATLGRAIDQRLLGRGSAAVETGRIDRLRVTGAGEGAPIPRLWGRMRLPGHVIWAADFTEIAAAQRRSKGKGAARPTEGPRYTVSLAVALCEGPVAGVGRIWADGVEIGRTDLGLRLYPGDEDQQPDPAIAAIEGIENVPAYRGTAYVVFEDLDLTPWGNRIPNLSFEVIRAAEAPGETTLQQAIRAVAWLPGSGEYALATTPVRVPQGDALPGPAGAALVAVNRNAPGGATDLEASLAALATELPRVGSGLLIVCWFGDDLRCGACRIEPRVEFADRDSPDQPWAVSGRARAQAPEVARQGGAPVYGGTPSDASVVQAIRALAAAGQKVVYYPFILMTQVAGNGLPDPYGRPEQPPLPWRGRITLSVAPGRPGSPDGTAAAAAEVAAFFGTVGPGDFVVGDGTVAYTGPADEWSYRRFVLHQAALCKAAGGVDAFCIGSEMVGLTTIRGAGGGYPAVAQLVALLQDVRALLGPDVRLTYAADWTEYFGHSPGGGERRFHLDPLWSHPDCDVIGIDNYMPLSDWRDGAAHRDAAEGGWTRIHDLDYLKANIAGGEGYDWFYPDDQARALQLREPITDAGESEPWVWRYKDLRAWWENLHYDRPGGVRATEPTAWVPRSKPVWFTELGCAAIDKGTNQPNKFLDPKSSESALPHFSSGRRDDLIQMQYLRAQAEFWADPANNPVSDVYGGPMLDWSRAHVWAWDARPWPWFPGNRDLWSDGANWLAGHWITGRATHQPLAAVVAEICAAAGLPRDAVDTRRLWGVVRGYAVASTASPRAQLQPLMLAFGLEAAERDGRLVFSHRDGRPAAALAPEGLAAREGGAVEYLRAARAETAGRVRLVHVAAEESFEARSAEAVIPDEPAVEVAETELPLALTGAEARTAVRRWLAEARIGRDAARFALPPGTDLGPGDVVALPGPDGDRLWRIDRVELTGAREVEAVRVEPGPWAGGDEADDEFPFRSHPAPGSPAAALVDLPLIRGDEVPQAPRAAVALRPWPGPVAVWRAPATGGDPAFAGLIERPAGLGITLTPLPRRQPGLWRRGAAVTVRMPAGIDLADRPEAEVLAGANLVALGAPGAAAGLPDWELVRFAGAELVGPGQWRLTGLLRGQHGTEPWQPDLWPAGTLAVLVDAGLPQLALPLAERGLPLRWRFGPQGVAPDDPAVVERLATILGAGLRPYAPVHLRARRTAGGDLALRWIRRTRIGGDDWTGLDVPLGEENERYLVQVRQGADLRHEAVVAAPDWTYTLARQSADGVVAPFTVAVAQVSAVWGAGPAAALTVAD